MKKKVLLVITKSNWGGAQRYVYDMATSLHQDSYDVIVVAGGHGEMISKLIHAGIRVVPLPRLQNQISITRDIVSVFNLWKLFRNEKPDIVHLNSSKVGAIGAVAGRLAFINKIVFTMHGLALNEERSKFSKLSFGFIYWLTITLSTRTIAVSHALRKQCIEYFPFIKRKINVIHNGISPIKYCPRDIATRELGVSGFVIGTIGELHPVKGQVYLIRGFKQFIESLPFEKRNKYRLIIIGEGTERKILEKRIQELDLRPYVKLVGHIHEASRYLKAFDIFVIPSLSEGLAYVIQEAGLAEVPVIATNVGGIPEMITHDETGLLITSRNPQDIHSALCRLTRDAELRTKLATNLNKKILSEFNLHQMVGKTERIY